MEELMAFLKENPTFYFATVEGYMPRVRPFGFAMEYKGRLYFAIGKHKAAYKQILDNTNIEICTANKKGEWIRLTAEAIHDPSIEAQKAMLDTMPELKKMYTAGDGNTAVFYLKNATATICSFTAEPRTITF